MQVTRPEGESVIKFFFKNMGAAATAACIAEIATIPIDTVKVRLQIQNKMSHGEVPKYKGFLGTMKTISGEEGMFALYNGLTAGLQRQVVFAGLRIGLYVPVRTLIAGPLKPGENPTLATKILAAMMTGTIGISVANPTDLVKVRMQSQRSAGPDTPKMYSGTIDCYRKIYAAGGIPGFWVGIVPNILRNSVINAAEIASYDQYKQMILQYIGLRDGVPLHILCASMAGFTACIFGSPFDVTKTRMMAGKYKGVVDCVSSTYKAEGFLAFYKGFIPNFFRLASWNIVMFVSYEQIKGYVF
jgi:solute carrier family 25 (mitochondrial uncoupling protein), member 8/9